MVGRYTMVNLFLEILKIEQQVIRASRETLVEISQAFIHPLMACIRSRYSKWAFEQMLLQFGLSFDLVVKAFDQKKETTQIL